MTAPKPKKVKLQPKHRALVYGQKVVPSLMISGVWLEELGFKAGEMVSITTREQLLIIEPVSDGDQRN
jgi:toxic protein SymE